MRGLVLASSGAASCAGCRAAARPVRQYASVSVRPFTHSLVSPVVPRNVTANFFKFGKDNKKAEPVDTETPQRRDDYDYDDVEAYFNYMGFLATEGTYDRMEAMLNSGLHYADIILLLACSENDTPKVEEVLNAGGDPTVKGLDGKQPLELASKPEVVRLLKAALSSRGVPA